MAFHAARGVSKGDAANSEEQLRPAEEQKARDKACGWRCASWRVGRDVGGRLGRVAGLAGRLTMNASRDGCPVCERLGLAGQHRNDSSGGLVGRLAAVSKCAKGGMRRC